MDVLDSHIKLEADAYRETVRCETLLQLRRHLNAVLSKHSGQVVGLMGEAGVGKTFVLETLLGETPCKSLCLRPSLSDAAIVKALPKGTFPLWVTSQLEHLGKNETLPTRTFSEVLAAMLSALAPFVLVFEDKHAFSHERLELVTQLAQIVPRLRGVGLFVTSRADVPTPFKQYWLERLDNTEITALLEAQVKTKLPKEGLEWVFMRSQGNPLFALEFWRYLSQQGYFWSDGSHWHWRVPPKHFVPPSLKAMMLEWINGFDDASKRVLDVRVLLPEGVSETVLAEVTGLQPSLLSNIQQQWEQAGVLRQGRLSHPLMTQVIREDIAPQQRSEYAEKVVSTLEKIGLEPPTELIRDAHLDKCKTLQIYERLATNAKNKNDLPRVGYWLALAAQQSSGQRQIHLALEAAQLLRHSDLSRALELAQLAAYAPPHDPKALYLCAELWATQGNLPEAEALLDLLHPQERSTQRWWETLIRLHYTTHANYAKVMQLWESHSEFHASASSETVVYICAVLGQCGKFEEAFTLSQALLKQATLEPFLRCRLLEMEATFHHLQGHSLEAAHQNASAITLARTLERPSYLAHLLRKEGIYAENQGHFDYMTACYREALQLLNEHGSPLDRASLESILASSLADQGKFQEAENLSQAALAVLEQSDNKLLYCDCCVGLALLYLDWQPRYAKTMALRHATLALELAQQLGNQQMLHSSLTTLALAEAYAGNGQKALELAQESFNEQHLASSEIRKARSLYALGMALEARGEKNEAITKVSEAVQRHHELGLTAIAHRFGLELDRIRADANKAVERRAWFESQGLFGGATVALCYFPLQVTTEAMPTFPRLCLLGQALLETEGKVAPYRGRKRLEILVYLLETRIAGKSEATFLELMDALYPDTDETAAKAILKQQIYLLRNQLGSQAIQTTASGYALGALETDVEHFLKTGDSTLFRGAYLDGLEGWYAEVREQLLDKLKEVALERLESNPSETLRLADIWQGMEPYDVQALALNLHTLQTLGDARKLNRLYEQGVTRFEDVGETLPKSSEVFLADFVTAL